MAGRYQTLQGRPFLASLHASEDTVQGIFHTAVRGAAPARPPQRHEALVLAGRWPIPGRRLGRSTSGSKGPEPPESPVSAASAVPRARHFRGRSPGHGAASLRRLRPRDVLASPAAAPRQPRALVSSARAPRPASAATPNRQRPASALSAPAFPPPGPAGHGTPGASSPRVGFSSPRPLLAPSSPPAPFRARATSQPLPGRAAPPHPPRGRPSRLAPAPARAGRARERPPCPQTLEVPPSPAPQATGGS